MKKISVIVPIYNAEKFIKRCVDSVISQTYENWELILIDDGSQDGGYSICKNYEALMPTKVLVIHQSNAGAGAARNAGLTKAQGDYIVFVDSDDMIRQGYFEALAKHDEEVVFVNVDNIDEHGKIVKREYMSDYKHLPIDEILRSQMTGKLPWGG